MTDYRGEAPSPGFMMWDMWAVAAFAVVALAADVVVHVAAVLGFDPQDWVRPGWVAAVGFWGLFVAVVAAGNAVAARGRRGEAEGVVVRSRDDDPVWFRRLRRVVVVYAVITLAVFGGDGVRGEDAVRRGDGTYVLDPGHGRPVQPITAGQYDRYRRNTVRAMSAFALMFYLLVAFDTVYLAAGKGRDAAGGNVRRRGGR